MTNEEKTQITVRCTPALRERLEAVCAERDIAMSVIASKAIERYLDNLVPVDDLLTTRVEPQS